MKSNLQTGPVCRMLAAWELAAVLATAGWRQPEESARADLRTLDNNPNTFYLWSGGTSFAYTFTYDPHAADVWLFQSGGGFARP
jgi:hypothetical protein